MFIDTYKFSTSIRILRVFSLTFRFEEDIKVSICRSVSRDSFLVGDKKDAHHAALRDEFEVKCYS